MINFDKNEYFDDEEEKEKEEYFRKGCLANIMDMKNMLNVVEASVKGKNKPEGMSFEELYDDFESANRTLTRITKNLL